MTVPGWVQESVFYQIFPDRFCNGDRSNDPVNVRKWEEQPTITGFQGGDIRGIIERMYYLLDLGVNAIYLNPIFLSPSTHRYNTSDYFTIDPRLGSLADFLTLLDVAHRNRMHVVLDGVFNHCSRGFFAFNDILENQADSGYKAWFHIRRFPVDAYSPGDAVCYDAWWKFKSLPKFNTQNPEVRKYIFNIARYWIEQGIDGWRLDVPNEIDDDRFWNEFRQVVRAANPDAYLLGEIWDGNKRWVGDTHFDGLMNYPVRTLIIDLMNEHIQPSVFSRKLLDLINQYEYKNTLAMYNLLGSHDVERIFTLLGNSTQKVRLAHSLLFALPGAPAIYYGDEIGLTGGKDPDCRKTFPWEESQWNIELRNTIKSLIRVRKNQPALQQGNIQFLEFAEEPELLGFTRSYMNQEILVLVNPSSKKISVKLRVVAKHYRDPITMNEYLVNDGTLELTVPAWVGLILIPQSN